MRAIILLEISGFSEFSFSHCHKSTHVSFVFYYVFVLKKKAKEATKFEMLLSTISII